MGKYRKKKPDSDEWQDMPGQQPESETALGQFRARGYWDSCFPEGDGITFDRLRDQSDDQVAADNSRLFRRGGSQITTRITGPRKENYDFTEFSERVTGNSVHC